MLQSSVDQQTTMLVLSHLSQAGRIDSLELESHSTKTYGCVQYFKSGPGDHLLNADEMEFGGVQVSLWKAKRQPTGELKIVDLNDKCLRKIFSYLGFSDLKHVSAVNNKFRHNAHAMFAIGNKTIKFSQLQKFATKEFMENFGHLIKRLEIDGDSASPAQLYRKRKISEYSLGLIASCCSLIELSLIDLHSTTIKKITELFLPVFPGLVTLKLRRCELSQPFVEVLRLCSEMTTFVINNCCGDWKFPAFNIPKFQTFYTLVDSNEHYNMHSVGSMLTNNPQLKKFVMVQKYLDIEIMNKIANNLPLVERIAIAKFGGVHDLPLEPEKLNALQHLKDITLGFIHWREFAFPTSIMKKLAEANIPLESLEIFCGNVPQNNFLNNFPTLKKLYILGGPTSTGTVSLDALDNLRNLRELVIGKCFTSSDVHLLKLISNNKHLHTLNFGHAHFEISFALYKKLVHVVQHRPEKIHLRIMLTGESFKKINYPQTHSDLLSFEGGGLFHYVLSRNAFDYDN